MRLDPALNGSDATLQVNHAYEADPEIAKWLHNRDFRRALSMGIDRDQLNETFWLGIGVPGSVAPSETVPYSPGAEWRKKWSTHDPKQANALLDKIGLTKKDGEGYRLRTDGKGRLRIELQTSAGAFIPHTQIAEMIKEQWKKIGIQADLKEMERSLFFTRVAGNEHQIALWANDGSEVLYLFPRHALPVDPAEALMGHPIARWYATSGAAGQGPDDTPLLKALEMFRTADGKKPEERIKIAQEIFKIMIDEPVLDRHRRPVSGDDGCAHRQSPDGEHPVAADQRAALPDALHARSPRRSTSRRRRVTVVPPRLVPGAAGEGGREAPRCRERSRRPR